MKQADLHLHTIYSDGTYTPQELVQSATAEELFAIAVTDHDTVEAVPKVLDAAIGEPLEVIPGIELTAEYKGLEIHILGYFIDHNNAVLQKQLAALKETRVIRVHEMIDKLHKLGIPLDPQKVFGISGMGTIGRLHVARALAKEGYVNSTWEAFHKYIGQDGPAYVLGFKLSPLEAVNLIRQAGGIAVLAHPYSLGNNNLIPELVKLGIEGLEVYYTEHTATMVQAYLSLARKYGLVVTGGSDCHGRAKPEVKIGMIKIDYELVEKLKQFHAKRI